MSVIEQAAKRLEELRRAGIEVAGTPAKESTPKRDRDGVAVSTIPADLRETVEPSGVAVAARQRNATQAKFDIDLAKLAREGFVTPDMPRSRIADEFRIVKRPLIANATGKGKMPVRNGNLIMVTSAVPAEGKTFCALNLAMSIAMELDRTVLLVDADVARPSLPRLLGLPACKGLLDAVGDNSFDLDEALLQTNVEKLTLLTSGTQRTNATELLASEGMDRLLEELASRFPERIVIFDSPPILVTTESRVLASHMGQIVFVVRAESTLQSDVKKALATIEACPVKMILLNQARTVAQGAYGYGYGYS
jgi:protein-tyrosine kinase